MLRTRPSGGSINSQWIGPGTRPEEGETTCPVGRIIRDPVGPNDLAARNLSIYCILPYRCKDSAHDRETEAAGAIPVAPHGFRTYPVSMLPSGPHHRRKGLLFCPARSMTFARTGRPMVLRKNNRFLAFDRAGECRPEAQPRSECGGIPGAHLCVEPKANRVVLEGDH